MIGIDFAKIRIVGRGQDKGFEEMVCQLARLERPTGDARWFRGRGAGGDGGVEAYWTLADATKIGYQAKYHPDGNIDWTKIDNSVRTAMTVHPTIRRYVIAFPCNLTPKTSRVRQKSGVEHWKELEARFPAITFERWDETELIARLIRTEPEYVGIKAWFFDLPHWTAEGFRSRFDRAVADLGERYHPDEHVAVEAAEAFDGLARTPNLKALLKVAIENARDGVQIACAQPHLLRAVQDFDDIPAVMSAFERLASIIDGYPSQVTQAIPYDVWRGLGADAQSLVDQFDQQGRHGLDDVISLNVQSMAIMTGNAIRTIQDGLLLPEFRADERRAVLLIGPAGIGKSHLLADVADRATREGMPALLVPGQWLNAAAEPWEQIKARLDAERFSTEQVLGAVNTAAEAANRRALILIDALNESTDAGKWRDTLGSLVKTILSYPCLAVAVSCRSDYLDWVVPEDLRKSFVIVECKGFSSQEEQDRAAQVFLDRKGIARPAMPWLAPDFTNPLFLRVTAEGLKAEGKTAYPQLVGLPDFFGFFLASLAVRPPFDDWPDRSLLRVCLEGLAREMVTKGRTWLSLVEATGAIRSTLAEHDGDDTPGRARTLLDDLKRGALLPRLDPQGRRDGVSFVFERLGDLLMAEAVIDRINAASFQDEGELAFVGCDPEAWSGLLGVLAIVLPQRRGLELLDVATTLRQDREGAQRQFCDSLLWRPGNAILSATQVWFDRLDDHYQLEVLIRLSATPNHPWNADYLDRRLRALTMPDRDVAWSIPLAVADDDSKQAIEQIIAWALGDHCHFAADETLRLTATVLAWMLTTSARPIRDRATKALAHIFLLRPRVMAGILDRFHDVNDPYVVERLWAAAYGAAMNGLADADLRMLAGRTWGLNFEGGVPPVSLLSRDHALGIMELVEDRGVLPDDVVMGRCRPPFVTSWPLEEGEAGLIEKQRNHDGAWDVASSVTGGDFGRYELESALRRWSDTPLSAPAPQSGQDIFDTFISRFVSVGSEEIRSAWARYEEAHTNSWQHLLSRRIPIPSTEGDDDEGGDKPDDGEAATDKALMAFLALLPPNAAANAEKIIAGQGRRIETYDQAKAQAWLVKRVLDFGWTAKNFKAFDRHLQRYGRDRPEIERIGKKYQWIALDELLARLSDNVHHIGRWPEQISDYRTSVDQPFTRDCDPSILPIPRQREPLAWWGMEETGLPTVAIDDMLAWVRSDQDVRCSSNLFDLRDPGQRPWLLLTGHFGRTDGVVDERTRESWSRVTTLLVRKAKRQRVLDAIRGQHISDPSGHLPPEFTDDGYYGEFPWRRTWPKEAMGTERETSGLCTGLPVVWPVIRYQWEGHLDLSIGGVSCLLPSGWLCEEMRLSQRPGRPGTFVDTSGETVFVDPAAFTDHSSVALIDRQCFLSFIDGGEWDCLWLIGGEKNWWPDGMKIASHDHWACRYHAGVFWRENGEWQSQTWSDFNSRGV